MSVRPRCSCVEKQERDGSQRLVLAKPVPGALFLADRQTPHAQPPRLEDSDAPLD